MSFLKLIKATGDEAEEGARSATIITRPLTCMMLKNHTYQKF